MSLLTSTLIFLILVGVPVIGLLIAVFYHPKRKHRNKRTEEADSTFVPGIDVSTSSSWFSSDGGSSQASLGSQDESLGAEMVAVEIKLG